MLAIEHHAMYVLYTVTDDEPVLQGIYKKAHDINQPRDIGAVELN